MQTLLGTSLSERREVWSGPIIDADVHAAVPSLSVLLPYLSSHWQAYIRERGYPRPGAQRRVRVSRGRPEQRPLGVAPDRRPPQPQAISRSCASTCSTPLDVDVAIINCFYAIDSLAQP